MASSRNGESSVKGFKKIKPKVLQCLKDNAALRDSDEKLIARVWFDEIKFLGKDPKSLTTTEFLKMYANNELSSSEHIVRARRIIENDYPELQGTRYNERHRLGKDVTKNIDNV